MLLLFCTNQYSNQLIHNALYLWNRVHFKRCHDEIYTMSRCVRVFSLKWNPKKGGFNLAAMRCLLKYTLTLKLWAQWEFSISKSSCCLLPHARFTVHYRCPQSTNKYVLLKVPVLFFLFVFYVCVCLINAHITQIMRTNIENI